MAVSKYTTLARHYAEAVVAGDLPACRWVQLACQRQLNDLARFKGKGSPYQFNPKLLDQNGRPFHPADNLCAFIERLPHVKGPLAGESIKLEPWQAFILTTVFGWVKPDGKRRFRRSYIEVPRGNAKSTLSSAVALYMLAADREGGAEVYSLATTRDQARIVFGDAQTMARKSAGFRTRFGVAVGGTQNVTAGIDGKIEATGISGSVDNETGLVRVRFGTMVTAAGNESQPWYAADRVGTDGKIFRPEPVAASSVRYSAVAYSYLPLDADLLGIDPVRLPSDGRVPIFRPGGFAVVGHTGKITTSVSNGQTIDCVRVRLSRVRVVGHDGSVIHTGYSTDLEAGTVTFTNVSGYSQPVTIEHRIEDMAVVRDVQISGEISFTRALTHEYPLASPGDPASGSFVSSALVAGDLFARVSLVFDQVTWSGAWSDALSGSSATATFNNTQYPIRVTNRGALTERWIVRFTNSTSFEVIGENVGVIATGNTSTDCAPNNPATGVPYFFLPALGWGNGWATGNVLRFNTIGAQFPVWVVRTVQQGPESVPDDNFTLLIRGDVDTP